MEEGNNKPGLGTILGAGAGAGVLAAAFMGWRWRQAKKRQQKVNNTFLAPKTEHQVTNPGLEITVMSRSDLPTKMKPVVLSQEESDRWKPFILDSLGQIGRAGINTNVVDGLLVCNVPISELTEVKGNPGQLRGYITKDGKFSKQAIFQEAGIKQAAPLLIMQAMAVITSQYYQQVITERLNVIEQKVDLIAFSQREEDRAKLVDAYRQLQRFSELNHFMEGDIQTLESVSSTVNIVKEKYKEMMKKVDLTKQTILALKDSSEARKMKDRLEQSGYFTYLDIARTAEVLYFVSNILLFRAADDLNLESVRKENYYNDINPRFWDRYCEDFAQKKHDVLKYLKLAKDSALIGEEEIVEYQKQTEIQFDQAEESFKKAESECDQRIRIVLDIDKDGNVIEYKDADEQ